VDHVAVHFLVVKHLLHVAPYLHAPADEVRGVRHPPNGVVLACARGNESVIRPSISKEGGGGGAPLPLLVWDTAVHTGDREPGLQDVLAHGMHRQLGPVRGNNLVRKTQLRPGPILHILEAAISM
jgi:hypothetical protein